MRFARFASLLLMVLLIAGAGCGRPPAEETPRPAPSQPAQPTQPTVQQTTTIVVDDVVDVREQPEEEAGALTQALFNEQVELLGDADGWTWVKVPDGYEGWVRDDSLANFTGQDNPWSDVQDVVYAGHRTVNIYKEPRTDGGTVRQAYLGTPFGVKEKKGKWQSVKLPGTGLAWVQATDVLPAKPSAEQAKDAATRIVALTKTLLGIPYLWGGTSPRGYDCSGLVYEVYKVNGIRLPRDAANQFKAGKAVDRTRLASGDLVFFATSGKIPTHVAIFSGDGQVIEAVKQGGVKTSSFKTLTAQQKYLGARRVTP